jgi:hypothetical protein
MKKVMQRGFLSVDVGLAITMFAMFSFVAMGSLSLFIKMKEDMDRDNNLATLQQALATVYLSNSNAIESGANQTITFPNPAGGNFVINDGIADQTTFAGFSAYMTGFAPANVWHDGKQQGARIFISNALTRNVNGITLQYRNIAIVMPGNYTTAWPTNAAQGVGCPTNRALYVCSTFNAATGQLTTSAEDGASIVFSTLDKQMDLLTRLNEQADRIVSAYESFFTISYYNDVSKSYAKDYFANGVGSWGTNTVNQTVINASIAAPATITNECTGASASTLVNSGLQTALGLSTSDVNSPWGSPICVDNASNNVRNPNNANASMQIAPFSARIVSALPGNQLYAKTVIGSY